MEVIELPQRDKKILGSSARISLKCAARHSPIRKSYRLAVDTYFGDESDHSRKICIYGLLLELHSRPLENTLLIPNYFTERQCHSQVHDSS